MHSCVQDQLPLGKAMWSQTLNGTGKTFSSLPWVVFQYASLLILFSNNSNPLKGTMGRSSWVLTLAPATNKKVIRLPLILLLPYCAGYLLQTVGNSILLASYLWSM
mmetsp:Transcript_83336/g.162171  ORF Transcript_83336/g.162171 Transcript_83336/m.162171 type:complete len:106 (+) Transcript_83336:527-844(+)